MKLLAITLGANGCVCRVKQGFFTSATFEVPCVDTTGAGDAFWGAVLVRLLREPALLEGGPPDRIDDLLDFANAAGALATSRKGAIPAMPGEDQIRACIKTAPRFEQRT
jgi:fructokinase